MELAVELDLYEGELSGAGGALPDDEGLVFLMMGAVESDSSYEMEDWDAS